MPIEPASTRFAQLVASALQLVQQLAVCELSDPERELLVLHALTKAHMDGMDAATEIANDAIARVVLRREHTTQH